MFKTILFSGLALLAASTSALGSAMGSALDSGLLTTNAAQLVVVLDASGSMTDPAPLPDNRDGISRWQIAQSAVARWQQNISATMQVAGLVVAGSCTTSSYPQLPMGDSKRLLGWAEAISPGGQTPLNAVLKTAPTLFTNAAGESRRLLIVSDGADSCSAFPQDTCDIVRSLSRDHGIVIDVVAFLAEPGLEQQLRCVEETGGRFVAPETLQSWSELSWTWLNTIPRLLLFALWILIIVLTSQAGYEYQTRTLKRPPLSAAFTGLVFGSISLCLIWIVLFLSQGWLGIVMGVGLICGALLWMHDKPRNRLRFK